MKKILLVVLILFSCSNDDINDDNATKMVSEVYLGMEWIQIFGPQQYIKKLPINNFENLIDIFSHNIGETRFFSGGAIDPNNLSHLYYLSRPAVESVGASEFEFIRFNLDTKTETLIGTLNDENWKGLEFDPTSGVLYAITTNALYSIDYAAATSTYIGETGINATSLAIDGSGQMYSYDINNDNFYSLNKNNGESSFIAELDFDAKAGGMAWDSNTDNIYLTTIDHRNQNTDLRVINKNSGKSSILGSLYGGFSFNVAYYPWISFGRNSL